MADCFISYRRAPSAPVATALQSKLEKHNIDAYVDTTRTDGTKVRFPERLMTAITDAPVFICLLGERDGQHTLESEWVLKEIQQAYDLKKFCIPVFQESYRPLPNIPAAVDYLLGFDGVHLLDQKNIMIDASVQQLAELIKPHIKKRRLSWMALFAALLAIIVVGVVGVFVSLTQADESALDTPDDATAVVRNITDTPTDAFTPTLSGFQQWQTTEAELTQSAGTQAAFELTLTEQFISDSNTTATAAQFVATETSAFATLLALSATPTPTPTVTATHTPTPTHTPNPLQVAFTPVTRNGDWTPIEREFNGVPMVLVPVGCFMMGDNGDGGEQCFEQPFWIDKTEVTQAQFRRLGGTQAIAAGFTGDERPVENVTWFEARNFCQLRGSRLPTEAEWEYAARGVENWVYPWGNAWSANNAVLGRVSSQGTATVGSIPAGASWVGALDMSGNVREWVSSLYESYPYDAADGREADTGLRTDVLRVLRGSSWPSYADNLRVPNRDGNFPFDANYISGFRCARSYNSSDL